MKKKAHLTMAFISMLLVSVLVVLQFVNLSSANFFPEQVPLGIRINSDGTVEGTDKIQRSGNVYTLTGDVYRTIVVLRDGIVLDGAGYTLQGNGDSTGVFLQERNDVTIKNIKICNFGYGIKFTWLSYGSPTTPRSNKVSGNTITNNTYGIAFYDFSAGNEVSGNYIADNTYGVVSASNTVFRNNQFRNNDGAISESSYTINDIDTSNTVNGKPIYYWVSQHGRTVPSDAGWVVLKNCSGITVQGLSLEGNGAGVLLCYTNDSMISGNIIANNLNGITLQGSSNNVISANFVANNDVYGIYLDGGSRDNNISDNRIEANGKDGVSVYAISSLKGNLVSQNQISNNQGNGISVNGGQEWKIVGNNITLNRGSGICFLYGSSGNAVSENYIAENGLGIQLSDAVENTITENTIIENNGWAIRLNGSQRNNVIHHNNFINNVVTEGLQVSIPAVWLFDPPGSIGNGPTLAAGNPNSWDDGREGNYWSDYRTRYPNATELESTGVWDTPYHINENNIDQHPLLNPIAIREVPTGSSSTPQPTNPPTDANTPEQEPDSSDMTLPIEYGYATIAVAAITIVSGYWFFKSKKSLAVTENSLQNRRCG